MPVNQDLEYDDVADVLDAAATPADAADCHGLLSGLVCATGFADPKIWVAGIFEAFFDPFNPSNTTDSFSSDVHRFLFPIEQFLHRRLGPFLAVERFLEAAFDETLPHVFHGLDATVQCFGDLRIAPPSVCLQQNVRPLDFWVGAPQFSDDFSAPLAFLLCQFGKIF